jgi:hypothetical protein
MEDQNAINPVEETSTLNPEPANITALRQAFEAALASADFKNDKKVVEKAIKALEIPDPDARFRKQFFNVAKRNLLDEATPDENGYILHPSNAAINAEVERLLTNRRAKLATA